eukprot:7283748-Karenia_brevis.AAC.1
MNRDLFGEDTPETKRKDEDEEKEAPEGKRRRTQEDEDWHDEFWNNKDRTIGSIEREEIEDQVDRWIQEIEGVVKENQDDLGNWDEEDLEEAWDDVHGGDLPIEL